MGRKAVCFYHSADLDGHCGGAIVALQLKEFDVELIGIDYGHRFPWEKINKGTDVYMVDFSLSPFEDMVKLAHMCREFVWIDHHRSAVESYYNTNPSGFIKGFLSLDYSGCELAWKYFSSDPIPRAVHLIGRYDIWKWEDIPGAIEFQYGLRALDTDPNENLSFWKGLIGDGEDDEQMSRIMQDGKAILRYVSKQNAIHARSASFVVVWSGITFIAINEMFNNSQLFDSVFDPEKHDAMLTFGYRKGKWHIRLYGPDKSHPLGGIDLGAFAKRYGGGGHYSAAGCVLYRLPFDL